MATAIKKLDGRFDVWAGARSIGGVVHKGFNLEFLGNHVGWFPTRKEAFTAAKLFIHHRMADLSDLSEKRAKNPAPRTGTKRPRRVSQITKKAPTTRLVARRKANSKAGYFPNPMPAKTDKFEHHLSDALNALVVSVNKKEPHLIVQAKASYLQGLIEGAAVMKWLSTDEIKLWKLKLRDNLKSV
jgi:hypothetical protein